MYQKPKRALDTFGTLGTLDTFIMQQAHVFISGTVQGVGYRYFVKSNAKKLGLTGWVRNSEDGGVEAVLQGDKETIEKMVALCRQGPLLSEVEQIGFEWEEQEEKNSEFVILSDS